MERFYIGGSALRRPASAAERRDRAGFVWTLRGAAINRLEERFAVLPTRGWRMITEGELAPDDVVTTVDADRIDLRAPGSPLVLFFFREAGSPASTDLVRDFDDQHYEFDAVGVRVVGVGVDGPERTAAFAASCGLRYPLADDASREVCRAFGVLDAADNRPHPTTFMIDVDGVVRRVFAGIPPFGHALDVVDDAREFWG